MQEDGKKENRKENNRETFSDRVLKATLAIPSGRVTTYGRIAIACGGGAMASQSITNILSKEKKDTPSIPFHRTVYADGHVWINLKHRKERMKLYKEEGIEIDKNNKIKNFQSILFEFE